MKLGKTKTQREIARVYLKLWKKDKNVTQYVLSQHGVSKKRMYTHWGNQGNMIEYLKKHGPSYFKDWEKNYWKRQEQQTKDKAQKAYAKVNKEYGFVTFARLQEAGISRRTIEHVYGSLRRLGELTRESHPEAFFDMPVSQVVTKEKKKQIKKLVSEKSKFFVSTAGLGDEVFEPFLNSIRGFEEKNDAELLVLKAADPSAIDDNSTIDKKLEHANVVHSELKLNSNLALSDIKLSTKQRNPLMGLQGLTHKLGTVFLASPQQAWETVPSGDEEIPRVLTTTGALTLPNYSPQYRARWGKSAEGATYFSMRTSYLAEMDHTIGGIVVEVQDDRIFHFRHVQASEDGSFCDWGTRYFPNGSIKKEPPVALVAGDYHSTQTNQVCKESVLKAAKELDVKTIILHDFFSGSFYNHHDSNKYITRAQVHKDRVKTLEEELRVCAKELEELAAVFDSLVVVYSNHHDFLTKYLDNGLYAKDVANLEIGNELALEMFRGNDPVKYGVEKYLDKKVAKKVQWLQRDEDHYIAGIQCGAHGDKGPNGTRGTPRNLNQAYGKCFVGHMHTPCMFRGCWVVGTMSDLRMGFNQGPSGWLFTQGLIYADGTRQMFNIIEGAWHG